VATVLELAQLLQDDRVTEVQVRRGRVHPELHAQRPLLAQARLEGAGRQAVDRVAGQELGVGGHPAQC
jgi:hypothetical protein